MVDDLVVKNPEGLSLKQLQIICVCGSSAVMGIGAMMMTQSSNVVTPQFITATVAGAALTCIGAILFIGGLTCLEVMKI
jgi:hypothetical protein